MFIRPGYFYITAFLITSALGVKNPKRGLAFADPSHPNDIKQANQSSSVISRQYNWGTSPPAYLATSNIEYVPMQWGATGIENFASIVKAQGAKTILSFNEPNMSDQSNINATYAALLWKQYIQPLSASGVRLGAPAISSAPNGRPWLSDFLAACTGCHFDFIPFHWYGTGIGNFYDYMWQMHGQFPNWPLWVTEYASTSSDDSEVLSFLNQTIRYMDTLDWIQYYSWFAFFRQESGSHYNLLDVNGNLNALGNIYIKS